MKVYKMEGISRILGNDFELIIKKMYLEDNLSGIEICDKLKELTNIYITPRSIQRKLRQMGIVRSLSEAFNLAIKKGRKSYEHLRKPIKSSTLRKGINLKTRFLILKRDNYRCVLCGNDSTNSRLVIDHITAINHGGNNDIANLRTLCVECNHGKMLLEDR